MSGTESSWPILFWIAAIASVLYFSDHAAYSSSQKLFHHVVRLCDQPLSWWYASSVNMRRMPNMEFPCVSMSASSGIAQNVFHVHSDIGPQLGKHGHHAGCNKFDLIRVRAMEHVKRQRIHFIGRIKQNDIVTATSRNVAKTFTSTKSPCGSMTATPCRSGCLKDHVLQMVDLPIPVFPMMYMWRRRSSGRIPKRWRPPPRKTASPRTVNSFSFSMSGNSTGGSELLLVTQSMFGVLTAHSGNARVLPILQQTRRTDAT